MYRMTQTTSAIATMFFLATGFATAPASAQSAPGGGTLRVMINADVRSTDPGVNRDLNSDTVTMHMLEGLVAFKEDLSVGPMLAEKVELSADGLTYSFTLRDGITFHNGKALTADDVLFAWKRFLDPATQWRCLTAFDGKGAAKIVDMSAPDAKTVVFKIEKPSALFLGQMARPDCGGAGIFHRDSLGPDGKWANPIGTGPFKMGEWRRGQWFELARFDGYKSRGGAMDGLTGGKQAHAEKVRFIIIPDGAAAKAALFSGSIDVRPDFSSRDVKEARSRQDMKIDIAQTMELNGILFNVNDAALKDVRVRRALMLSIDRDELVEALTDGLAKPVYSPIPLASGFSGAVQKAEIKQNIVDAKKLLAEAGYKGEPIKMITTKRYMSLFDGSVFVQAMAKQAGINIEVEVLEWPAQLDLYGKGVGYQSMFFSFSARLDPSLSFEMITGPKDTETRKVWNNPEATALITRSMVISDAAQRQAIFDDLQTRFVADLPMVPLWNSTDVVAYRSNVTGYKPWAASQPRLWNVKFN